MKEPKSWRTSAAGWLTLLGALCAAVVQVLNGGAPDISVILAALAGVGLLAARDQKAHDEEEKLQ